MSKTLLSCHGLCKSFHDGELTVDVLNGIDFSIKQAEKIALIGSSGSGKTTLLHLLAGLDVPTSGEVYINGQALNNLSEQAKGMIRNQELGFIFQFHHLLPEFTAIENVMMPLLLRQCSLKKAKLQAEQLLVDVGLKDRLQHKPGELSGGERQRTAMARALVTEPACVIADEPTGNLDKTTANRIYELILSLNEARSTSFIIATHDSRLAENMDRVLVVNSDGLTPL